MIEGVDYSGLEEKIKQAAEACPVEVIKYDEDDDLKKEKRRKRTPSQAQQTTTI